MAMQILHRKIVSDNPFRRALCQLMSIDGDTLILSTGFATNAVFNTYNDSFIKSIITGFKTSTNPKFKANVKVIGGMFQDSTSRSNFKQFLNDFHIELAANKIGLEFYRSNNDKWHSKIALKLRMSKPIAGIVGSSNLSAASFSKYPNYSQNLNKFNYESDIYMWNGNMLRGKNFKGILNKTYTRESLTEERDTMIRNLSTVLTEEFDCHVDDDILKIWAYKNTDELRDHTISRLGLIDADSLLLNLILEIKELSNTLNKIPVNKNEIEVESIFDLSGSKRATLKILDDLYEDINQSISYKLCNFVKYNNGYNL